jgi:uncharacterized protein YjbI with pentapeptide repeats
MARIFLSHAKEDKASVRRLASELEAAGHQPWFDDVIQVGSSIPREVFKALRQSDYVVLCLSDAALRSNWVAAELDATVMQQLKGSDSRVLPVRLGTVEPPESIAHLKFVDLFPDEAAWSIGFQKLLTAMATGVSRPASIALPALPSPPIMRDLFVGREQELERLRTVLLESPQRRAALAGIKGFGGIGKTALAMTFAGRYASSFPGGVLWGDLGTNRDTGERGADINPQGVLRSTLQRWAGELGKTIDAEASNDSLIGAVRNALAARSAAGACLAVLDNVDSELTLTPMMQVLSDCAVLITTRQDRLLSGNGLGVVHVDRLERVASLQYLKIALPNDRRVHDLDAVLDHIEDHPYALTLLVPLLSRNSKLSASELLEQMRRPGRDSEALSHIPQRLKDTFKVSIRDLPRAARAFLISTASQSPTSWPLAAADYVSGVCSMRRSRQAVEQLTSLGLVQYAGNDRYRVHRLLRDYLRFVEGRRGFGFLRPTWEVSSLARLPVSAGTANYDLRQEHYFFRYARKHRADKAALSAEWDGLLLGVARQIDAGALQAARGAVQRLKEFLRGADLTEFKANGIVLDGADLDDVRMEKADLSALPLERWPNLHAWRRCLVFLTGAVVSLVVALHQLDRAGQRLDATGVSAVLSLLLNLFLWIPLTEEFRRVLFGAGLWFDERSAKVRLFLERGSGVLLQLFLMLVIGFSDVFWTHHASAMTSLRNGAFLALTWGISAEVFWLVCFAIAESSRRLGIGGLSCRVVNAVFVLLAGAAAVLLWKTTTKMEAVISVFFFVAFQMLLVNFSRDLGTLGAYSIRACYFRGARLRNANLRAANFAWARFQKADLSQADLTKASLRHARLEGANLTRATLVGADLTNANLEGAVLDGVVFDDTTRWPEEFVPPHVEPGRLVLQA